MTSAVYRTPYTSLNLSRNREGLSEYQLSYIELYGKYVLLGDQIRDNWFLMESDMGVLILVPGKSVYILINHPEPSVHFLCERISENKE